MRSYLEPKPAVARIFVAVATLASSWPTGLAQAQMPAQDALPLPIELYGNHIFGSVSVNSCQRSNFILDTGASAPFLNGRRIGDCNLEAGKSRARGNIGTGEGTVRISRATRVSLKLDGVDLSAKSTFVLPLDALENTFGRQVDGILGPEIFEQNVVEIDYEQRTLRLHDVKGFSYTGPGQSLPIEIRNHRLFLIAKLEVPGHAPTEGLFVIDIGDNSALSLHTQFVIKHKLAPSEQDALAHITQGVVGGSRELIGRAQSLQIGALVVRLPVTAFSQATKGSAADRSYDGAIGGEILRRFKLIFDYRRHRLILEPNTRMSDPFEADMSGLTLSAQGDGFQTVRCDGVAKHSPASEAAILEGDILQAIDGQPAVGPLLPHIQELFREDGKAHTVRIQRGGKPIEVVLTMRRRI